MDGITAISVKPVYEIWQIAQAHFKFHKMREKK